MIQLATHRIILLCLGTGSSEQLTHARRVAQERVASFRAREAHVAIHPASELLADGAYAQLLGPRDVEDERRCGRALDGRQGNRVRVALPDGVEGAGRQVDRLPRPDAPGQVDEDTVPQLAGVVQAKQRDRRRIVTLKCSNTRSRPRQLMAYSPSGRLADRPPPTRPRRHERVHVAGRERDDAARGIAAADRARE